MMVYVFGPVYSLHGLTLRLSALTEDSSMITVSSCSVKLQKADSGLERQTKHLGVHMHFCGFSQHYNTIPIFSFHLGCNYEIYALKQRMHEIAYS